MSDTDGFLNAQQRKKMARKKRMLSERQAHRNLDSVTGRAIEQALRLASEVAAVGSALESDRAIEVDLESASEAQFVRKRVNDALQVGEWLDEVRVWVWRADEHGREPLTESGRASGVELRMERRPK